MAMTVNGSPNSQLELHTQPAAAHGQMLTSGFRAYLIGAADLFTSSISAAMKSLVFKVVNGVNEVWVQVGDIVYRALLDCVAAVARAAEWVFDKIKVLAEDLIAFLGFLFQWKDIIRTKGVIKNLLKQLANKAAAGLVM